MANLYAHTSSAQQSFSHGSRVEECDGTREENAWLLVVVVANEPDDVSRETGLGVGRV